MRKSALILFVLLTASTASAELTAGLSTNFVTAGVTGINIKSLSYIGIGWKSLLVGPLLLANSYHSEYSETGYGGFVQFGEKWFLQLGGGVLEQNVYSAKKDGAFGVLVPGIKLGSVFAVSFPVIYRSTSFREEKIQHVDSYPMFGVSGWPF